MEEDEEMNSSETEEVEQSSIKGTLENVSGTEQPLLCRTIRIGSFKVYPGSFIQTMDVHLASEGISFFAPMISDCNKIVEITLKPSEISHMIVHFGKSLPLLFVSTTASFAEALRRSLNMTEMEHAYYDPTSNDATVNKIIFVIDSVNEEQQTFLRHNFLSDGKVRELDQQAANEILVLSTRQNFKNKSGERKFQYLAVSFHADDNSSLHSSGNISVKVENKNGDSTFYKGLQDMLLNNKFSDFVINVGEKEFRVHRVILAARSPVFAAMFEHDMKEKKTNSLNLEDYKPDVFSDFLHFLYTGETESLNPEKVLELYELADKYLVVELSSLCVESMMNNISIENILDILDLGLRFHVKELIDAATQFFLRNPKQIALTAKWITFLGKNPVAGTELFLKTLKKE